MSVGLPSRGGAGPRAGTFAPRHQSRLGRAFAKGGVARSWDWLLFAVTCALTVLGPVRGWAATEPALRQAGLDPHTYLKKAILWAVLGFVLMMVTACIDYRRIRRWTPVIYGVSLLLLGAVLAVGQSVNGAKAWIALPGGVPVRAVGVRQTRPDPVLRLAAVPATFPRGGAAFPDGGLPLPVPPGPR